MRSRSARSSRSRRCRRGCCSRSSRCSRSASKSRPHSRCSGGSSSTSTCRSTSSSAPMRGRSRRPRRRRLQGPVVSLLARRAVDPAGDQRGDPRRHPTALVGETGSGKTTLAYLVARLYEAERGAVTIDGTTSAIDPASLAETVGLVSQETYLFHASIRENLRFACPEAGDGEIEEAARAAQIHGLISGLPEGYDTLVGERGYRFSGGRSSAWHRPDRPAQPARADPRRGYFGARQRDRACGPAGTRRALSGSHDDRDRAPPLDRSRRRPDPRARRAGDRRRGTPRRAAEPAGATKSCYGSGARPRRPRRSAQLGPSSSSPASPSPPKLELRC